MSRLNYVTRQRACKKSYWGLHFCGLACQLRYHTEPHEFLFLGLKGEEGVEECKKRWKQIRDRYVKERRKVKGKSGAGRDDVEQPTWVLFKYLLFLEGQIRHRRSMTITRTSNGAQAHEPRQGDTGPAPQGRLITGIASSQMGSEELKAPLQICHVWWN